MSDPDRGADTTRLVARLQTAGTWLSVTLAALGTAAMVVAGRTPIAEPAPTFHPQDVVADVLAGRPVGLLWASLVVAVALPSERVALAAFGYARDGDRRQAAVALGVFCVLGVSLLVAVVGR